MDQELMDELASQFRNSLKVLNAVGAETRQAILMALLQGPQDPGMRVGEIRGATHFSRPVVSHHLRILIEAGIVSVRKDGTRNYYRLDSGSKLMVLKSLVNGLEKVLAQCELSSDSPVREELLLED
ncbi:metalloregulator ArsR/SmtB family transcription factor [Paenibacillus sp. FSL R7-0337]|uniref:ArsR/SmtB family transcription factor n=1 Tax=unclassified Paenibacillus TaxID=185978 RepID=UPI0021172A3F|nr:metalloregulator ArsR/SmtB family transcription factor [Paenibacillus sp. FSL R7-0337]